MKPYCPYMMLMSIIISISSTLYAADPDQPGLPPSVGQSTMLPLANRNPQQPTWSTAQHSTPSAEERLSNLAPLPPHPLSSSSSALDPAQGVDAAPIRTQPVVVSPVYIVVHTMTTVTETTTTTTTWQPSAVLRFIQSWFR